jgi:hypothetical protein
MNGMSVGSRPINTTRRIQGCIAKTEHLAPPGLGLTDLVKIYLFGNSRALNLLNLPKSRLNLEF